MNTSQKVGNVVKTVAKQHWPALLILVFPIHWAVYQSDADTIVPLLILPAVALIVGIILRPRNVWLVWLGAVVIQWIAMGVLGKYADPEDETVLSLILEAFAWMAIGVLLPIWIGRTIRNRMEETRHSEKTPGRPAG